MPVENPTYIDSLEPDWPLGSDPESAGDDHLRLIKKAVQNTFPNVNAALTGAPSQFNNLTSGIAYASADETNNLPAHFSFADPVANDGTPVAIMTLTPSMLELNAHPTLNLTWENLQNLLYPIGSVVIYADNVNPNTRLGFGTWEAVTGVIAGVGSATASSTTYNYAAGLGGSGIIQQANIAKFTITPTAKFTGTPVPNHTHGYFNASGNTGGNGGKGDGYNTPNAQTGAAGGHTPAGSVTIDALQIGTATANYAPIYNGLYVWKRTA